MSSQREGHQVGTLGKMAAFAWALPSNPESFDDCGKRRDFMELRLPLIHSGYIFNLLGLESIW